MSHPKESTMSRAVRPAALIVAIVSGVLSFQRISALRRHIDVLNRVDTGSVFASAKAAADN
jgi:hypothetical protein